MRNASQIIKFALALLGLAISTIAVFAHNGKPVTQDICTRVSGGHMIHFNAYQAEPDPRLNYCHDIPNTGETSISIDLVSAGLRKIPIALKIYRIREDGKKITTFELKSERHPSGLIQVPVKFEKIGHYMAEVIIEGNTAPPPTLKYRVGGGSSVSLHLPRSMMILLSLVAGIGAMLGITKFVGMIKKRA